MSNPEGTDQTPADQLNPVVVEQSGDMFLVQEIDKRGVEAPFVKVLAAEDRWGNTHLSVSYVQGYDDYANLGAGSTSAVGKSGEITMEAGRKLGSEEISYAAGVLAGLTFKLAKQPD
jgi:hypothetical protein